MLSKGADGQLVGYSYIYIYIYIYDWLFYIKL